MLQVEIHKQLAHFNLHVHFTVGQEIAVLFGPSGSGKTTILNCIAGLMPINSGFVKLNDEFLIKGGKSIVPVQQRKIGYLFQDYALFPHMTVWKNIAYGMKSKEFAHHLMQELRIEHLKDQYPYQISGGEKQRVALTRAFAIQPQLLLLDEPFSALDDENRLRSHDELLRIHHQWKIPILFVTHKHDEAKKLADQILYLNEGKLTKNHQPIHSS